MKKVKRIPKDELRRSYKRSDFTGPLVRGKYAHLRLNVPIYLDSDVAKLVERYARRTRSDARRVVNRLLRRSKEVRSLQQ
ncbi:MAG: hypothetical protein ACRD2L_19155 [Terriglobia bacterium]